MARMLGQPVDQALVESIEREEKLAAAFFGEKKEVLAEEPIPILKEDLLTEVVPEPEPPVVFKPEPVSKPAETNIQQPPEQKIQKIVNYLNAVKKPSVAETLRDNEFEALRKTVADLLNKVNTLSWGGGGTGVVRINDQDDFDRTSYADGRYLRWINGMFRLDEVNPHDVTYNTTEVNVPYYMLDANDYYLGVTYAGPTIELPTSTSSGREIVIKDETGNCSNNPIIVTGTIDNDANGFILQLDSGGVHLLFRNGWRII